MTVSPLYLIRRCDSFYRYWHDFTAPAPLHETYETYERLTGGGAHSMTPEDSEYYEIFRTGPLPNWRHAPPPLVRRLHRRDAPAVKAHLLSLGPQDRRLRFFREVSDHQIGAYADSIDWSRSVLVGAILSDRLIGLAEAVFDHGFPPRRAEIAVSVDRAHRRHGLGRHLVEQVVERAELLGAARSHLIFLQENRPLRQIVRALGGLIEPDGASALDELVGILGRAPITAEAVAAN